jgi:hypothetical protein
MRQESNQRSAPRFAGPAGYPRFRQSNRLASKLATLRQRSQNSRSDHLPLGVSQGTRMSKPNGDQRQVVCFSGPLRDAERKVSGSPVPFALSERSELCKRGAIARPVAKGPRSGVEPGPLFLCLLSFGGSKESEAAVGTHSRHWPSITQKQNYLWHEGQ